ncbi:putative mercury scavenger protein:Heavy-metal-associated domain protein [Trichinella spiralis]|uniref:putative mercury scavenger protein:Heavy-metal-associated domain protein n=1 Tax=Trichinella spiralis TaxID=6334 RepID=UPI0001EFE6D6|nr:putative mercury scavenger protein:Heavy-metal-associated domain protein [Trichinella spiralis]
MSHEQKKNLSLRKQTPAIKPLQNIHITPLISKPAIMQLRRYPQIMKLLLRIYRKQCPAVRVKKSKDVPFEEDSYAESRPSTSIQLSDLTTRRRSVALKISDTKDNVPAMRRATRSEGYPSDANVTKFHA